MNNKKIEKLIKESFKDLALRIIDLNHYDRKSLLNEYREWIVQDPDFDDILMLPYEAYTNRVNDNLNEDH